MKQNAFVLQLLPGENSSKVCEWGMSRTVSTRVGSAVGLVRCIKRSRSRVATKYNMISSLHWPSISSIAAKDFGSVRRTADYPYSTVACFRILRDKGKRREHRTTACSFRQLRNVPIRVGEIFIHSVYWEDRKACRTVTGSA